MILPSFVLPAYCNLIATQSGMDSPEHCVDIDHYRSYPWPVVYKYNSRGYRDAEWPEDLGQAIWCFGDSFTVGLGSTHAHTWTQQLQKQSGIRTINIGMNGASNNWIARKIQELSAANVRPGAIAVHWSYLHRRELPVWAVEPLVNRLWEKFYNSIRDESWSECKHFRDFELLPDAVKQEIKTQHLDLVREYWFRYDCEKIRDEERRLEFDVDATPKQDVENLIDAIHSVEQLGLPVIHSFIPNYAPNHATQTQIEQYCSQQGYCVVTDLRMLDRARDGHHYDILTAQCLAHELMQQL
ncbi:hypothetical protein [Haliscomenobacter sp.]|uniref:hypothetical protein n=1 Tax=Haliscomenobacter sp. TaxID=2717303 RepID=UPI003364D091